MNAPSFENIKQLEIDDIKAELQGTEKKFLSHTNYIVTVRISSIGFVGQTMKRYNEFNAFYEAVTLRFGNLPFPHFPSKFQMTKKIQTRIKAFQDLLNSILEFCKIYEDVKNDLLLLFYRFVIQNAKPIDSKVNKLIKRRANAHSFAYGEEASKVLEIDQKTDSPSYPSPKEGDNQSPSQDDLFEDQIPTTIGHNDSFDVALTLKDLRRQRGAVVTRDSRKELEIGDIPAPPASLFSDSPRLEPKKRSVSQDEALMVDFLESHWDKEILLEEERSGKKNKENTKTTLEYMIVKHPKTNQWKKYHARIQDGILMFCHSITVNDFSICFVLYQAKLEVVRVKCEDYDDKERDLILLTHKYDSTFLTFFPDDGTLMTLKKVVREIEKNQTRLPGKGEVTNANKNVTGKLVLEIKKIPKFYFHGDVYIQITVAPYTVTSLRIIKSCHYEYNQLFFIPIHNKFQIIKIEIINVVSEGWFTDSKKRDVIASFQIPIPDLQSPIFEKDLELPFSLSDSKRKGFKAVGQEKRNTNQIYNLVLSVNDQSTIWSNCDFDSNRDFAEEREVNPAELSLKEIRIMFNRIRRIMLLIQKWQVNFYNVLYWEYPNHSIVWFILAVFIILFFDPDYSLPYAILLVLFIVYRKSTNWDQNSLKQRLDKFFFTKRNKYAAMKSKITTKFQIDHNRVLQLKFKQDQKALKQENKKYLIKEISGLFGYYKAIKRSSIYVINFISQLCDYIEKFRNLIIWSEPKKTLHFMYAMVVGFFFLLIFPFRYLMLAFVFKKFIKGYFFFEWKYRNNKRVGKILLSEFHHKYGIKEFDFDKPWVIPSSKNWEKDLVVTIRQRADGYIEKKEIENIATPGELVEEFGGCEALLKLEYFFWDGGIIYKQDKELYRKSRLDILYLFNYVYKIPSDYYRLRHPCFSVERYHPFKKVKRATTRGAADEYMEEIEDEDEDDIQTDVSDKK